jgi:hypothetical protein
VRLRSDIWVAAYLRRVAAHGAYAVLRRRGAPEAGAIFVLVDRLDGRVALFAPAPGDPAMDGERRWFRTHAPEWTDAADAETRLAREARIDPDIWIVVVERRDGVHGLELAEAAR